MKSNCDVTVSVSSDVSHIWGIPGAVDSEPKPGKSCLLGYTVSKYIHLESNFLPWKLFIIPNYIVIVSKRIGYRSKESKWYQFKRNPYRLYYQRPPDPTLSCMRVHHSQMMFAFCDTTWRTFQTWSVLLESKKIPHKTQQNKILYKILLHDLMFMILVTNHMIEHI